ncbi:glycosyltransferase family 2 protein [Afipia broomeae]|uniref:Glycosyltransferase 2-like domain-containing protein n=1 Tax=Afipia broomeae ATCC 49717 TaxID=883078 RepID=K8P9W7_9BRAD|nr:TIGR00180 family glycosyltransferase [Afipia broomeae]EKS36390.1 hypothetical protein HMPREF9695_02808 [Afipia broomeae ATCC 49717]
MRQCTIIIPTHARPEYLARCVRWFSEFGCPIIIADSSVEISCGGFQAPGITHIHCPGGFEVYPRKLQLAFERVATPYVAMCADDDFITLSGLQASVSFLEESPEYAFSQGYAYLYQVFGRRVIVWPMVYPFHNNESDDWVARVENAKSTIYYGVNRTDLIRDAIKLVAQQDFREIADGIAGFVDAALTFKIARAGKFKCCEIPFALREYSANVSAVGRRFGSIVSRNVPDFYANLVRSLMGADHDSETRKRLHRLFAADYAGQIMFDLSAPESRKARLERLPGWALQQAEYLFRLYSSAKLYATPEYRSFLQVFSVSDYHRFKSFVLEKPEP